MPDGSRSQSGGPWKVLQLEYKIPVLRSYMSRLFPPTAAAITYHAMLSASQVDVDPIHISVHLAAL